MRQRHLGLLVSLKLKGREKPICGLVASFNENWMLLKNNTVDYVIDGFVIVRADVVKSLKRGKKQEFVDRVIRSKGVSVEAGDAIPLGELEDILTYLTTRFGVFSIENRSGTACNLCRFKERKESSFTFDTMNPKGEWDGQLTLDYDKIKVVEFESDYIKSLKAFSLTK